MYYINNYFNFLKKIYLISTHGENIRQIIAGIPGIFGIIVVSQRVNLSLSFKHRFPATNNLVKNNNSNKNNTNNYCKRYRYVELGRLYYACLS